MQHMDVKAKMRKNIFRVRKRPGGGHMAIYMLQNFAGFDA